MKHIFLRLALILITVTVSGIAMAAEATLQQVVDTLEKGYAKLNDLHASFQQTTVLAGFPKPQKGQGEVWLRRPAQATAQFRFDYSQPKQQIISNGKQVWFYQPESRQVIVTSLDGMMKGGNSVAMAYLTGLGNVSQEFQVAFAKQQQDKQGNYQLELTPRKASPVLAKLRLTIKAEAVDAYQADGQAKEPFPVLSSIVVDGSGTETRISYTKVHTNSGLSASKFTFKVPQGVEIIKP